MLADKVLFIAPGTDFPDIVATLGSEGVIDNELIFNIAVLVEGRRSKIKAGEYLFKQSASMRDVIDILVSGRQVLHSVTIPEGLTSEQIVSGCAIMICLQAIFATSSRGREFFAGRLIKCHVACSAASC